MNHTKLPWKLCNHGVANRYYIGNSEGTYIGNVFSDEDGQAESNAKFIVKTANNYESLLNSLKLFVEYCETNACWDKMGQTYYIAKRALKKAEEQV